MTVRNAIKTSERTGTRGEKYARSFQINYLIETDDPNDGPATILASLPQIGSFYDTGNETDLGARVTGVAVSDVERDSMLWEATITYNSIQGDESDDGEPEPQDPVERTPELSIRFERFQEPMEGVWNSTDPGKLSTTDVLRNSAGQPFNPPPTKDATRGVISVTIDEESVNLAIILDLQDVVNTTSFAGFDARTLKLNITGIQERFEENKKLWQKTYEIAHNRRTWDRYILDQGTVEDAEGNLKPTLLLNSSPTTGDAQYLHKKPYEEINFSTDPRIPERVKQRLLELQ